MICNLIVSLFIYPEVPLGVWLVVIGAGFNVCPAVEPVIAIVLRLGVVVDGVVVVVAGGGSESGFGVCIVDGTEVVVINWYDF
mgnify:CR=1 FL=1